MAGKMDRQVGRCSGGPAGRLASPPKLYHFTCAHGREGIAASGALLAHVHPFMRGLGPLLWLTDLAEPSADSVGLTSEWQSCDRRAYRYVVRTRAALPWAELRWRAPAAVVAALEAYGEPLHWWVVRRSLTPSEFALDASYGTRRERAG